MQRIQSLQNKKGEVEFRKDLAQQLLGKKIIYPGEPTETEFIQITKDRVKDYTFYFQTIKSKGVLLSPYLEIGGGVGQGAMLLENKFGIHGFTSDISYETLSLGNKYLKYLGYKKMPIQICCDIYNLPFHSKSIPFIFTFQTLHHLPDPYPVLKEIKRVLSPGGYFYFNEEPIAQLINLNLWRRDRHLRWFEKILKAFVILHFISRIGKSEVDHNILEETFTLDIWEKALHIFAKVEAELVIFPFGLKVRRKKLNRGRWLTPPFWTYLILQILGGGIGALCQKGNNGHKFSSNNLLDFLACPNCSHKPKLTFYRKSQNLYCSLCQSSFKNKNGIFMLLSKKQEKELYQKMIE